jgi:hypothetical protein
MRLATRAILALVVLGFLMVGALLLASAAIGPQDSPPAATSTGGASRPAAENWRTNNSLLDGIPVALGLIGDFAWAWIGMTGLRWYHLFTLVALVAFVVRMLRRRSRRHVSDPLPV